MCIGIFEAGLRFVTAVHERISSAKTAESHFKVVVYLVLSRAQRVRHIRSLLGLSLAQRCTVLAKVNFTDDKSRYSPGTTYHSSLIKQESFNTTQQFAVKNNRDKTCF